MRKLFLMFATMLLAAVACNKAEDGNENVNVDVTITANSKEVSVGGTTQLIAKVKSPANTDITITVKNANTDIVTVAATEIKIAKGESEGSVDVTGVKAGSATISFESSNSTLKTTTLVVDVVTFKPKTYTYPVSGGFGSYGGLVGAKVGDVEIECGKEYVDEMDMGCFSKFIASPYVPMATGDKITIYFSTGVVYDGYPNSGDKGYYIDVYADWDNNGAFDLVKERIGKELITGDDSPKQPQEFTITVPEDATSNSVVRVIFAYADNGENSHEFPYEDNSSFESGSLFEFVYVKKLLLSDKPH